MPHEIQNSVTMRKIAIISVALALCSCGAGNNQTQEQKQEQTNVEQAVAPVAEEVTSLGFDDLVTGEEDDFFAQGDLNHDGIEDLAVIARKETHRDRSGGIEPVKGDGLRIYFGDADGRYTLFNTYAVNTHPEDFFADWSNMLISADGDLFIQETYDTDGEVIQNYYVLFMDDEFYLTSYVVSYRSDDDNVINYDLVNKTLTVDVDWHEMDTDINHHRTDTYELKDVPLKKLSDFKIGDEVCSFDEYVEDDGLDVFKYQGNTKEELCSAKYHPTYEEGGLNERTSGLVVNALNKAFAFYYKIQDDEEYHLNFIGKGCDKDTKVEAYLEEGNLIVNAISDRSMSYTFRDNGYGYYRLVEFEQIKNLHDGLYHQVFDFVNCTKMEWTEGDEATPVKLSNCPEKVFEEFHFGDISEIDQLIEEL